MPKAIQLQPILESLQDFYRTHQRLPAYSELQTLAGYRSKGAAAYLVKRLIEKRIVIQDESGRLIPGSALKGTRVLGSVKAGFPSPAEEELLDTLTLDEFLIRKPNATYIVKVSGDSMIEEGIKEGDLVLVERGRQAQPGDIVIAQVDGQWTMKYLEKRGGRMILRAANRKYPEIEPKGELVIGGVVIANVRKYK